MTAKVYLVGEDNPYGSDPEYALWPHPANASGHRLMTILGLSTREYVRGCERRNLCKRKWSDKEACKTAEALLDEAAGAPMVLLGRKVAGAFLVADYPAFSTVASSELSKLLLRKRGPMFETTYTSMLLLLPHPSGRCRDWNVPGSRERAKVAFDDLRRTA